MPFEDIETVYVTTDAGAWLCIPPDQTAEFHHTRHDAVQSAILWAYLHRPARAVLHRFGSEHLICRYGYCGRAEVFEPLRA